MAIVEIGGVGFKVTFTKADERRIMNERAKMRGRLFRKDKETPLTIEIVKAIEYSISELLAGDLSEDCAEGLNRADYESAWAWCIDMEKRFNNIPFEHRVTPLTTRRLRVMDHTISRQDAGEYDREFPYDFGKAWDWVFQELSLR